MTRPRRPEQTLQRHFLIFTVVIVKSMQSLFRQRHELLRWLTFTVYWTFPHGWALIHLRVDALFGGKGISLRYR
jgi:hypothetical protein